MSKSRHWRKRFAERCYALRLRGYTPPEIHDLLSQRYIQCSEREKLDEFGGVEPTVAAINKAIKTAQNDEEESGFNLTPQDQVRRLDRLIATQWKPNLQPKQASVILKAIALQSGLLGFGLPPSGGRHPSGNGAFNGEQGALPQGSNSPNEAYRSWGDTADLEDVITVEITSVDENI